MNQSYILTQEIIENYRLICRKEPRNIENWLMLGRCLVDTQQFDQAEEALTKIFEAGRFFSFKNGVPRLRPAALLHWRRNRLLFAKAYADMAMISLNQANLAESERLLTMALTVFEKENSDYEYARAANRLGMVYRLAGAFESAEEAHYRAKKLAEKHGWKFVLAETLGDLGMVYEGKDRFDQAVECHREALALYETDGKHGFETACVMRQIGLCRLRSGAFDQSRTAFERALELFEKQDDFINKSRVLNGLSLVAQARGDLDGALDAAEKSVAAALESKDGLEIAANRLLLGGLMIEKDPAGGEIEKLLTDALAFFKTAGKKAENANAAAALGLMHLRRGDWARAESFFRDSLHIEEMLHRSLGQASDYSNLGLIASKRGQSQKAAEYWQKAALLFEKSGDLSTANYFKEQSRLMWGEAAGLPRPK